jgi:NADH-quinone oxidoreductase subunit N
MDNTLVIKSFFPEIVFLLSIFYLLIYNIRIIVKGKLNYPLINEEILNQIFFILFCLITLYYSIKIEGIFSNLSYINAESIINLKISIVLVALISSVYISKSFILQNINFFEFWIIFLMSLFSSLIMLSTNDLLSFYLVLEMQALCFYILSSIKRDSSFSTEAGIKYFISASFISGFYLLGITLIYYSLGTLNLSYINMLLFAQIDSIYLTFTVNCIYAGLLLVIITFLFKLACAPFHFWVPDVYEGSPLSSTLIFSIFPKISLCFFLIKIITSLNSFLYKFQDIIILVGLFSVIVGMAFAFSQKKIKKLIIYSSISQIGFIIVGIFLNNISSISSTYFFILIYIITSIVIFGFLVIFNWFQFESREFYNTNINPLYISSFSNLHKHSMPWSITLIIIFFSVAGIPPFIGFTSKLFILLELIISNYLIVSSILLLISSLSAYYYIRIVKISFFELNYFNYRNTEIYQTIYSSKSIDICNLVISFIIFALIYMFYNPAFFYLSSHTLVLSSIF